MAGELVINKIQLGEDITASNNFVLKQADTPNGTLVLSNGNIGTEIDRIAFNSDGTISAVAPATGDASSKLITSQFFRDNRLTLMPPITMTGTSVDTTVPTWVKRVTISFAGVSLNGASEMILKIGPSGGVVSTGYVAVAAFSGPTAGAALVTTYFPLDVDMAAGTGMHGSLQLNLLDPSTNTWTISSQLAHSDSAYITNTAGSVSWVGTAFTNIKLAAANGTDAFDAGVVSVMYE